MLGASAFLLLRPRKQVSPRLSGPARQAEQLRSKGDAEGLARMAEDRRPEIAVAAVRAFASFGPEGLPRVEAAMQHPDATVRETGALAISRAARDNVEDVPRVARILADTVRTDPSTNVRAAAVQALGAMWAAEEMDVLVASLDAEDPAVRRRAEAAVDRICGMKHFRLPCTPEMRRARIDAFRKSWAVDKQKRIEFVRARRRARSKGKP